MKHLFFLLIIVTAQYPGRAASWSLPESWSSSDQLLVKFKSNHSPLVTSIRLSPMGSLYEENLDGKSINVPFTVKESDLNTLLLYLKDRGFNRLKTKKLKSATVDKDLRMIYWKQGDKVVFSVGFNAGIEVHSRSQKTFQSILVHLIQFTERYTEPAKKDIRFFLAPELKESILDLSYVLGENGQRGWFANAMIPTELRFHLFPSSYSIRIMLQDSQKAMNRQSPDTKWVEFEFDAFEDRSFEVYLENEKLRIRSR